MGSGLAPAQAQGIALLRANPDPLDVGAGETATITIELENAQAVYAIDVVLAFDPAALEVVDADLGKEGVQSALGYFPVPDFVARNIADNEAGTVQYTVTQINPTPPSSGQGIVFSFQVRGKAVGETSLNMVTVEMADRSGILLEVETLDATIRVGSSGSDGPTGIALTPLPDNSQSDSSSAAVAATDTVSAPAATPEVQPGAVSEPAGATPLASPPPNPTLDAQATGVELGSESGNQALSSTAPAVATGDVPTGPPPDSAAIDNEIALNSGPQAGEGEAGSAATDPQATQTVALVVVGSGANTVSAAAPQPAANESAISPSTLLIIGLLAIVAVIASAAFYRRSQRGREI
jgi:hypothetical protein